MENQPVAVSTRLDQVRYDIRGPLSRRAHELEAEGTPVLRLNIGNPGLFGFRVPQHLRDAISEKLPRSEAYCHQQGLIKKIAPLDQLFADTDLGDAVGSGSDEF